MRTSKRNVIVSVSAVIGVVLLMILGVMLFSGGHNAHAVTGTSPDAQTINGQINQVSVDTITTNGGGNLPGTGDGAVVGPVDPVVGSVPLGNTQTVDVIIDEIAVQDGLMSAFQFNLLYNQAVVNITSESALPYMVGAGASQVSATCPTGAGCLAHANTTGNLLIEWAHFDGTGVHYGEGMLVRLTVQCIGASAGFSPLTLTDTAPGGQGAGTVRIYTTINTAADPSVQMAVTNVNSGTIYCGEGVVTPSPSPSPVPSSATLTVSKAYVPSGPLTAITATPTCTSGTITAPTSHSVDPNNSWKFTITGFTAGATCSVSETGAPGYTPTGCQNVAMTDTLDSTCTITNTQTSATFNVSKFYNLPTGTTTSVLVTVTCGSTSPNLTVTPSAATSVSPGPPTAFAVKGFNVGDQCTATESPVPPGYSVSYGHCANQVVTDGGTVDCSIYNTLNTATFTVNKDFSDKPGTDTTTVSVTLSCGGGTIVAPNPTNASEAAPAVFTVTGIPTASTTCTATEGAAPANYTSSGCTVGVTLSANGSASCTITNNATATLQVTKIYSDATTTPVMATPSCTAGTIVSPAPPQSVPTGATGFTFNLSAFPAGATCTVSETGGAAGYAEDLAASNCDTAVTITAGLAATCHLNNVPSTTTFTVIKDFIPNNAASVSVALTCTGTAVIDTTNPAPASEATPATFTVSHFSSGNTCTATEGAAPAGYTKNETACTTVTLVQTTTPACTITNTTSHTFTVAKDFVPDNASASATVSISCSPNGGSVTPSSGTVTEAAPRTFTVTGFTPDPTCTATESPIPSGYSTDSPCSALLSVGACTITNTLNSATLTVNKNFSDSSSASVTVSVGCTNGGTPAPASGTVSHAAPRTYTITGFTTGTTCTATETVPAGYTKSDNCAAVAIAAGGTPSCTITNTLNSATLTVNKNFSDNSAASVTVSVTCTSGTPAPASGTVSHAAPRAYTITGFNTSATCTATETVPAGYTKSDNCASVSITNSGTPSCTITNAVTQTPSPTPTPSPTATPSPTPTLVPTATPSPTPTPTASPAPTPVTIPLIWGDTDCGGTVAPRDAQAILKRILEQPELSVNQPCPGMGQQVIIAGHTQRWADWDCSGDITPRDAQAVLKNVLQQTALSQTQPCPAIGSAVDVQLIGP